MVTRYSTLNTLLEQSFARFAERPAFTCAGHTLSYAEVDQLSRQFAVFLRQHLQLQPGDRIALQLPNVNQYPVVIYGALRAGLVVVNTNPLYTPRELEYQLNDSGAKVLVVLANVAHTAAEVIKKTAVEQVVVTEFADLMPWPKRTLINFLVRHVKKMVKPYHFERPLSLLQALRLGADGSLPALNAAPQDLACLQYTGGTTGVAKGAMLTHDNICSNAWQVLTHNSHLTTDAREVFATPLPLYHIYAFCLHAVAALSIGGHNLLIPNPRDIPATVKALASQRFSVFVGLNTLFKALCRDEAFARLDFSALKSTPSGGMALTSDAAAAWKKITGCEVCEGYGLTETSPVVTSNRPGSNQPGTIGTLLPETQAKVVNTSGETLPAGEPGELCVKGPQVMLGYWQKPAETAKVFDVAGWLKTGDIAIMQEDGFIKLVDRKKDMVIVSGFNVYPNELEDVLCQHPDILEAAVVGVPDEQTGEAVKAFLVAKPGLTQEAVMAYCREQFTAYKKPKYIEFRTSLPKSNVGKILRRELRDEKPQSE
jgi:long-chain acyl-CoA synthetase